MNLAEMEPAVSASRELADLAFWLDDEPSFPSQWMAPVKAQQPPFVCYGPVPGRAWWVDALWLWKPCGLVQSLGAAKLPRDGRDLAEKFARLIPGARVLECRP